MVRFARTLAAIVLGCGFGALLVAIGNPINDWAYTNHGPVGLAVSAITFYFFVALVVGIVTGLVADPSARLPAPLLALLFSALGVLSVAMGAVEHRNQADIPAALIEALGGVFLAPAACWLVQAARRARETSSREAT